MRDLGEWGPILGRFLDKVEFPDDPDGCWEWTGYRNRDGYGGFRLDPRGHVAAHRVSRHLFVGDVEIRVPEGRITATCLTLDHLCRNRGCVDPFHLEPVTNVVNSHRGETLNAANAAKTHCPQGHEYSSSNTYLEAQSHGESTWRSRRCRECRLREGREYRRHLKAQAA